MSTPRASTGAAGAAGGAFGVGAQVRADGTGRTGAGFGAASALVAGAVLRGAGAAWVSGRAVPHADAASAATAATASPARRNSTAGS